MKRIGGRRSCQKHGNLICFVAAAAMVANSSLVDRPAEANSPAAVRQPVRAQPSSVKRVWSAVRSSLTSPPKGKVRRGNRIARQAETLAAEATRTAQTGNLTEAQKILDQRKAIIKENRDALPWVLPVKNFKEAKQTIAQVRSVRSKRMAQERKNGRKLERNIRKAEKSRMRQSRYRQKRHLEQIAGRAAVAAAEGDVRGTLDAIEMHQQAAADQNVGTFRRPGNGSIRRAEKTLLKRIASQATAAATNGDVATTLLAIEHHKEAAKLFKVGTFGKPGAGDVRRAESALLKRAKKAMARGDFRTLEAIRQTSDGATVASQRLNGKISKALADKATRLIKEPDADAFHHALNLAVEAKAFRSRGRGLFSLKSVSRASRLARSAVMKRVVEPALAEAKAVRGNNELSVEQRNIALSNLADAYMYGPLASRMGRFRLNRAFQKALGTVKPDQRQSTVSINNLVDNRIRLAVSAGLENPAALAKILRTLRRQAPRKGVWGFRSSRGSLMLSRDVMGYLGGMDGVRGYGKLERELTRWESGFAENAGSSERAGQSQQNQTSQKTKRVFDAEPVTDDANFERESSSTPASQPTTPPPVPSTTALPKAA